VSKLSFQAFDLREMIHLKDHIKISLRCTSLDDVAKKKCPLNKSVGQVEVKTSRENRVKYKYIFFSINNPKQEYLWKIEI
jgi:hypothetical protein